MDYAKVVKEIEEGIMFAESRGYEGLANTMRNALAMLKEQKVEPFHKCIGKDFILIEDSHFDYCPYCGKPITWAKQEGR